MSKLQIPDNIIIVGASLYTDLVQKDYLERIYPYLKTATRIDRFPSYNPQIIDDAISIAKCSKTPLVIFVHDRIYKTLVEEFDRRGYKKESKNGAILIKLADEDNMIIIKSISLFNKLESLIANPNRNVANFKLFGKIEALNQIEDELCQHAIITKVLPTWYNVVILDSDGEKILIDLTKKLNVKLLPIASVRASLIEYLTQKNKTISFAESCTGGLLAYKFISKSGASNIIKGTMVTYSNEMKHKWLGVKEETLEKYGAVSKECVSEMVDGIKAKTDANIAVAISGIAGPTGETPNKGIGLVYIGLINDDFKEIKEFHFKGDRNFIQEQAVRSAIEMIILSEEDFFKFF